MMMWSRKRADCEPNCHRWGKWRRIYASFQRRSCKVCGWEETASIPINGVA